MYCACCGCGGGGPGLRRRNETLDQIFAKGMATGMAEYEGRIAPVKQRLFRQLAAPPTAADGVVATAKFEVVEIGAGTGPNLPFYDPASTHITAVDPNSFMRPYLQQNMARLGWREGSGLSWVEGVAEALPLADGSVDAVVCTLVLCSVDDVAAVLREVTRVLRPGGRFLFIEHTAARGDPLLRLGQALLNPLQIWLADGCHLTRDPLPEIEAAGFGAVEALRFEVEGMGVIAPHVAGIATL